MITLSTLPGVSLAKITDDPSHPGLQLASANADFALAKRHANRRQPWYPLAGHREGLRANDMISLHSAFVILSYHGGTAHQAPQPGTIIDGNVVPFQG
jgi:hypothetical protein